MNEATEKFLRKFAETCGKKISLPLMKEICPSCAEYMEAKNLTAIAVDELLQSENFVARTQELSRNLCEKIGGAEGFFDHCKTMMKGQAENLDGFCAELHNFCLGKYPSETSRQSAAPVKEKRACHIIASALKGSEFEVVLIEAGYSTNVDSSNGLPILYDEALLSNPRTLQMFEGVSLYAYEFEGKHEMLLEHLPDAARAKAPDGVILNKVGLAENARFGEFQKSDGSTGKGIIAKAKFFNSTLRDMLKNAWEAGKRDIVGFSIDAVVMVKEIVNEVGAKINQVLDFIELPEVTIVDKPGAGGILVRMLASANHIYTEPHKMNKSLLALFRQFVPHLVESITDEMSEDEQGKLLQSVLESEAVKTWLQSLAEKKAEDGGVKSEPGGMEEKKELPPALTAAQITEMIKTQTAQIAQEEVKRVFQAHNSKESRLLTYRGMLTARLKESSLPADEQDEIKQDHYDSVQSEEQVNLLIKRKQDKLARMKASGLYVPFQEEKVAVTQDVEDKWSDGIFAMLTGQREVNKTPAFVSLHESFSQITGLHGSREYIGAKVYNDLAHCMSPNFILTPQEKWRMVLRESRLAMRAKEASVATTTWAEAFGDSMRRALLYWYASRAEWESWRNVAMISNAPDFRTMRRVRVGGLVDLADVAELGTYQEITIPPDEEETFAVGKKGNIFSYSMESAYNDDLGALAEIPKKIAFAAKRGLYKTVFDVFRLNPTMGDGVALFHATHGNLGSAALSDPNLRTAIQIMRDQTEYGSNEPLGFIQPKYVIIPNELEATAWELARASVSNNLATPTRNETIENWFLSFGLVPLPPIAYWTDANDWALCADPQIIPTIEVSFLNGRQEPEIMIQDQPNVGSVYSADKISLKGRFIYGVKALDPRGMFKAVVA